VRARIVEARSASWLRLWLLVVAVLLAVASVAIPQAARFAPALIGAGGLFAIVAAQLASRVRSRDVEMRLGFGWVEVRSGDEPWARIEGKQHGVARIAKGGEGASLALTRGLGPPMLVELRDEADAHAVQNALGAQTTTGPDIGWSMEPSGLEAAANAVFGAGILGWITYALAGLFPNGRWASLPFDLAFVAMVVGAVAVVGGPILRLLGHVLRPELSLDREGLRIGSGARAPVVPYVLISDVKAAGEGLQLTLRSVDDKVANHPRFVRLAGLTAAERAHVATHILSAAREAQGWGKGRRAETLRMLRRAEGEDVVGWLGRIDAMAPKKSPGTPYRAPGVEKKDLKNMIEDPAAPRDVRIAATRMLQRIDPVAAKPHVAALGATTSEEDEAYRLQAAVEAELDAAAAAYDDLKPAFKTLRVR
jgi:hypothetical protein